MCKHLASSSFHLAFLFSPPPVKCPKSKHTVAFTYIAALGADDLGKEGTKECASLRHRDFEPVYKRELEGRVGSSSFPHSISLPLHPLTLFSSPSSALSVRYLSLTLSPTMKLFSTLSLLALSLSGALAAPIVSKKDLHIRATGGPVGFASTNGGTTGGAGGKEYTVKTLKELTAAVKGDAAKVVYVDGLVCPLSLPSPAHARASNTEIACPFHRSQIKGDQKTIKVGANTVRLHLFSPLLSTAL